jgi:hypothetical protein
MLTMTVVRMILLFQLFTIYPIVALIWRSSAAFVFNFGSPEKTMSMKFMYNLVLMISCCVMGIFLPSIGMVITVFGSLCGFVIIFLAPAIVDMTVMKRERTIWNNKSKVCFHMFIIAFGLANCCLNNYHFFETMLDKSKSL